MNRSISRIIALNVLLIALSATAANAGKNRYICEYTVNYGGAVSIGKAAATNIITLEKFITALPGRGSVTCNDGANGTKWQYEIKNGKVRKLLSLKSDYSGVGDE